MKYKVFLLIIFCVGVPASTTPMKKLLTKRKVHKNTVIETREPRAHEAMDARRARSISMERSLERDRQMTKCLDISKIFVTVIASIIGIVLAGAR